MHFFAQAHSNDLNGALDAWLDNSAPLPPPKVILSNLEIYGRADAEICIVRGSLQRA